MTPDIAAIYRRLRHEARECPYEPKERVRIERWTAIWLWRLER